jgi:hypothetical protein
MGDGASARIAMQEALKANPDFQEGIQLLAFISKKYSSSG